MNTFETKSIIVITLPTKPPSADSTVQATQDYASMLYEIADRIRAGEQISIEVLDDPVSAPLPVDEE